MARPNDKASTAVATQAPSAVPAHLQGGKTVRVGNIDSTDQIIPRIKLLQGTSPEIEANEKAKPGLFWHTISGEPLGETFDFTPIIIRKSFTLWAPRGDERGILARARDAIHWDTAGVWEVKPKKSNIAVKWSIPTDDQGKPVTVAQSRLDQFGTSIPGDNKSPPAASLAYEVLCHINGFPDSPVAVMLLTRSAIKHGKMLISKIEQSNVNHYGRIFSAARVQDANPDGDKFWNYNFVANGYVSESALREFEELYNHFSKQNWAPNDLSEDVVDGGGANRPINENLASKI